ncbi:hypothetical protein PDE_08456 [Penicillium oxalicum 114-2]|uniref:Uncharacterized protein n=1 Tax=Penicillium oxalicum (strain 114-2 / CGMCC 5302) TaxID=933388 RepID=S7ZSU0_PENO1|nr:hypothetical protein PDE_08456 [Penicillium oxalicum 114-2]
MKAIYLVGAPVSSDLDWDHDTLLNDPIPPFGAGEARHNGKADLEECGQRARWRLLQEPRAQDIPIGNLDSCLEPVDPRFLNTCQLVQVEKGSPKDDSILSEFYDHSFVAHETSGLSVSQQGEDEVSTQESEHLQEPDENDPASGVPDSNKAKDYPSSLPIVGAIRDLNNVPTAYYLQSIIPQTMTVNLVVGVIAIHPPRRVVTQRYKTEMDIVEVIVGDETRAGFGVNFWLTVPTPTACRSLPENQLHQSLAELRPRDIILLRNVGLGSFRQQVYGHSLRGGMTRVELLARRPVDATDMAGIVTEDQFLSQRDASHHGHADRLLRKAIRVRRWVRQFVGEPDSVGGEPSGMSQIQRGPSRLPPDTQ